MYVRKLTHRFRDEGGCPNNSSNLLFLRERSIVMSRPFWFRAWRVRYVFLVDPLWHASFKNTSIESSTKPTSLTQLLQQTLQQTMANQLNLEELSKQIEYSEKYYDDKYEYR